MGHTNNTLYRYNKYHYNLHPHCTLKTIRHKRKKKKLERDKQGELISKTCGEYLCKII